MASPLTNLVKEDSFYWSSQAEEAFLKVKHAITSAPVLTLPNFSCPFVLGIDASGIGTRAVLSQNNHPIAFFSKKLAPRYQRQSAYVREFLAITEALSKFCHYLLGHHLIIRMDQQSLKSLLDQSLQTLEQQAWLNKFIDYDFKIEYRPGKENLATDALSRMLILSWSEPQSHFLHDLWSVVAQDTHLAQIATLCAQQNPLEPNYSINDGLLYWKSRLVITHNSPLVQKILSEYHTSPIGGHVGVSHTLAR